MAGTFGLPEPVVGVKYIVSQMTGKGLPREDLLVVDEIVRDFDRKTIGCRSFAMIAPTEVKPAYPIALVAPDTESAEADLDDDET